MEMSLRANLKDSDTSLNEKTQKGFVTLTLITQACHGVLNTTFVAPDPKPPWYDDLLTKLDAAKVVAADWINNLAPEVTSSVPVAVINYGTTFDALCTQIRSIADAHPDAQGKDNPYVIQVNALVGALIGQVNLIISSVDGAGVKLKGWGIKVQTAHDDLAKGAVNIQSAEVALQGDIDKMNNAINTLRDTIHQENMAIAGSVCSIPR